MSQISFAELLWASYESWLVLLMTAVTCALIGSFLVLRRMSMIADAISHSVLLGIVLAFFIVGDLDSPLLIMGAAALGLVTVWSTERLSKMPLVDNDDAIGIVYSFFFALAIILITSFAGNVHLDTDVVLTGEVILAPLNRVDLLGWSVPKAFAKMFFLFILNSAFIGIFFKELKLTTFDESYSLLAGFYPVILFYSLMSLVSVSTVVAFDAVGAILVVAFLIGPGATAYLICDDLKQLLLVSSFIAMLNATLGYFIGILLNVSLAGMTAVMTGILFFIVFLFHSRGLVTSIIQRSHQAKQLKQDLVLMHIKIHTQQNELLEELKAGSLDQHFNWNTKQMESVLDQLFHQRFITIEPHQQVYQLTRLGEERLEQMKKIYDL